MTDALADKLIDGDRAALARGITLVESTRADHQARARELLTAVMDRTGKAWRIGLTGVPGVGKSTLIERLGGHLTDAGRKVAVLAVDPSSSRTKGSILGDKTRMGALAVDRNASSAPPPAPVRWAGSRARPANPCCCVKRRAMTW